MQLITLPQLPGGVTAATVVRWLKQPGKPFSPGDTLVELEIEEALVHLEASKPGTIAQALAQPRNTIKIGAQLAQMETNVTSASQSSSKTAVSQPSSDSAGPPGGVLPILMPQAGNTMEEGGHRLLESGRRRPNQRRPGHL